MSTAAWKLFSGNGLRAQIAKASGAALLLKVVNIALGFATTVLLARALGPDSFGIYAFALAAVMVVGLPAKAGVPQLVLRETAKGQASGQWGLVKAVWRWSTAVVLLVSAAVLLAGAVVGAVFAERIGAELTLTLAIGLLMIPIMGLALVRASSLRGLGHTVQGQLPELAIKPAVLLALLIAAYFTSSDSTFTASVAMGLNITATVAAFIVGALLLQRVRPGEVHRARPKYESRAWLATIIPMASINAMHLINTQADILLIGFYMDKADVGMYKVAAQISMIGAFGLQATKMVAEPYFARFHQEGRQEKLERLAAGVSVINVTVALSIFAFLVLFGHKLLHFVFGVGYSGGYVPLLVLSGGWVVGAWFSASGQFLVMAGLEKQYLRVRVISVVVNLSLNFMLIPVLGLLGAALATSLGMAVFYSLGWRLAWRSVGVDLSGWAAIRGVRGAER